MKMTKFIPILCFFYTGLAIYIFMVSFYYEEIGGILSFSVPIIIFAPLLLGGLKNVSIVKVNLSALAGFLVGFTTYGINKEINIWPIAMVFWLSLSIPSIAGLNMVGNKIKKAKRA
jgi:hypothetical protein